MNKLVTFFICLLAFAANAQPQPTAPEVPPYGKVSMDELTMKVCDFEKNANAEVLFDVGKMNESYMERHVRIKIFNDFGKQAANFRIAYPAVLASSAVRQLDGETVNLENGKIEITPLDKKQIYIEKTNRLISTVVFALPDVKAGSVIEFRFKGYFDGIWNFQTNFPTRYSEIQADFAMSDASTSFKFIPYVTMPYVKNEGGSTDYRQIKALANIPSLTREPFSGPLINNLQRIDYIGLINSYSTWPRLGELLSQLYDHDQNIDIHISREQDILKQAQALKTDDEKIAFIFDYVRDNMNWNRVGDFFAAQSTANAWDTKTGSSAEINWIIYHLLKKAGIKSNILIISNKENGKMNPAFPQLQLINNMAVIVPVDSVTNYVLDGSDKYNTYNVIPKDYLNNFGLMINRTDEQYNMVFLDNEKPVVQQAYFNVTIMPNGKLTGTGEITSDSYNKYLAEKNYKTLGEKTYLDSLTNRDNSIKISAFKMENVGVDTLPLIQKIDFTEDLQGSDEQYIYFNPNLFALMGDNRFKSESRSADIDFGYRRDFSISSVYKIPDGFKVEALPKNITSVMGDRSIVFKRMVVEENGSILVRYTIDHRKSIYFKQDYPDFRAFYKNMYELMNEQIVLKKS
jgi:hypothetical protein